MCCQLCHLPDTNTADDIDSDVQVWLPHLQPRDFHSCTISFPLQPSSSSCGGAPSFLCTQGVGGSLTHFLHGNLHVIDFFISVGTPIVTVCNGTIVQVKTDSSHVTGIAVSNLFHWNSILLQLDNDDDSSYNVCSVKTDSPHESAEGANTITTANDDSSPQPSGPLFIEYVHIASAAVSVGERVVDGQVHTCICFPIGVRKPLPRPVACGFM